MPKTGFDRKAAIREVIEKNGYRLVTTYYLLHDKYGDCDFDDENEALVFALFDIWTRGPKKGA